MKSSKLFFALVATITLIHTAAATAASIDMDDPRRALGREGDIRIDAQLIRETVTPGTPIGITYQVQNLSASSVAIAPKVTDASYDEDSRTITLAIGSEVPPETMPHMVIVAPGETKVFQTAATPRLKTAATQNTLISAPRYVQVKVAILRNLQPFAALIQNQDGRTRQRITDELFEKWFESNDTIFLNSIPVQYVPPEASDVESRGPRGQRSGF